MHPRPHAAPPAPGERAPEVRGTDIPTERGDGLAERAPEVRGTGIPTEEGDALVDRAPLSKLLRLVNCTESQTSVITSLLLHATWEGPL